MAQETGIAQDAAVPPEMRYFRGRNGIGVGTVAAIVVVAILVVAALALGGVALGSTTPTARGTITVTGSGTVHGTPDTVSFSVGVTTTRPTAIEALGINNQRIDSLERVLGRHGVLKRDMQTSGISIYEVTNSTGTVSGFTVNDSLDITIHSVSKAGSAIEAAAQAAGNSLQLSGITFSISNSSAMLASARARAMQGAHTEASQLASGGNATIGGIVKVTDQQNSSPPPIYSVPMGLAYANAAQMQVPLEAGSQTINVQVTVVYALSS